MFPEPLFRLAARAAPSFTCPVCGYSGPFRTYNPGSGKRRHAQCPRCRAMERHRLQCLAFSDATAGMNLANSRMLHIAPEPFFSRLFSTMGIGHYETGDLAMKGVDHVIDLCSLPFADGSYDIVYASHVLEHIQDDQRALAEIYRILSPGGIAILPVPIVVDHTVEYDAANPLEEYHVRAPGLDYFNRYRAVFDEVTVIGSADYPQEHQLFIFEDRSVYPTRVCPQRTPMNGQRHSDFVPVCRKLPG